jgi:dTDP-4-dehydrorhamnose reductase
MDTIQKKPSMPLLPELWGGIECSINRIGNTLQDQCSYSGYHSRTDDLELFASLGIKAFRLPMLWEHHQNSKNEIPDFDKDAVNLNYLQSKNIKPIAGLLHHGSGPLFTSLSDPAFPFLLSSYAKNVAEKFPSLDHYTIVNEPLTTARFSGLYGHWYPHEKNDHSFAVMFLNQLKSIVLSMEEIRKINPSAKLIQTEDLGKTYGSSTLQYQCDFENERRWLTYDFLTGKFDKHHYLWNYFRWAGIDEASLNFFQQHSCKPELIGINYYVTSERFLDASFEEYPPGCIGGNGKNTYADIEAARIRHSNESGCTKLFDEAWERYQIPLAITEIHLNGFEEEQVKWFNEICSSVISRVMTKNIPIKAVTAWALLGNHGWDKLLTSSQMKYDPGCFDIRTKKPRERMLAKAIRSFSNNSSYYHPLLSIPGWWKRNCRFLKNPEHENQPAKNNCLVIFGKGTLANAISNACRKRSIPHVLIGRQDCDVTRDCELEKIFDYKPWAIINAAGFANAEKAEKEIHKCYIDNVLLPDILSEKCADKGIRFATFSSDLVFDGLKNNSYSEYDSLNPLNNYGKAKALSEQKVLKRNKDSLIIRTSAFFSPGDTKNFIYHVIQSVKSQMEFRAAEDVIVSPTYVPELANATIDLLLDEESGIWHVANKGEISWSDLALETCNRAHLSSALIKSVRYSSMNQLAALPPNSSLISVKGQLLSTLDEALGQFFSDRNTFDLVTS